MSEATFGFSVVCDETPHVGQQCVWVSADAVAEIVFVSHKNSEFIARNFATGELVKHPFRVASDCLRCHMSLYQGKERS